MLGSASAEEQRHAKRQPDPEPLPPIPTAPIAMSRAETLLVSSAGDLLTCRDRDGPYPASSSSAGPGTSDAWAGYEWQEDLALLCCDAEVDDLSTAAQETGNLCSPWGGGGRGGLLGGAEVAAPLSPPHDHDCNNNENAVANGSSPRIHSHNHNLGHRSLNNHIQNANSHTHHHHHHHQQNVDTRHGLYGGGDNYPPASPWKHKQTLPNDDNIGVRAKKAFRSPPLRYESPQNIDDAESIVPIKSFDYSHYGGDGAGNDMLPERRSNNTSSSSHYSHHHHHSHHHSNATSSAPPKSPPARPPIPTTIPHGIPTFLSGFAQVKVTQISAHPLGSHVLLISDVNLLYSYGLNDYGQLGIGIQTPKTIRYLMHPNIVTPLAEHGGKAILCAAGVSHSLVVVATEERRLVRSQSVEGGLARSTISSSNGPTSSTVQTPPPQGENNNGGIVCYHQLYGFGRNDYTKIGLVSPKIAKQGAGDEMEHVTLPHRVALRCKVRPDAPLATMTARQHHQQQLPPPGIFCVAASAEHSAALVRRSTGDVELYTWGNAMYGALGLPPQAMAGLDHLNDHTSLTAVKLVPVPSFVASLSRTSNPAAMSTSLLAGDECPVSISLGRRSSLVLTSTGRCFSFGLSDDGILGLGEQVTEAQGPSEIVLPESCRQDPVAHLHAGGAHAVAVLESGRVLAWGRKANVGLAFQGPDNEQIAWNPEVVPEIPLSDKSQETAAAVRIVQAAAGYDGIALVASTGQVFSCGRNSGRLGQGDAEDDIVGHPRPLFGGLQLWHHRRALSSGTTSSGTTPRPPRHQKSFSQRGISIS